MNFVFLIVLGIATGVTALFLWGAWELLRAGANAIKKYEQNRKAFSLSRHANNPILQPGKYDFEKEAVMNPAAVHDGEKTHLFYRAIGSDGVSRIGYASSEDGMHFDDRVPYPVFALEGPDPHLDALRRAYAEKNYPALVASGGSWGGTEDPRAVIIDGRVYLSFSAFQNWDSVRMGVTSIALEDLKKKNWKWSPVSFLSQPNQVHKNWVLFPEKIHTQFAMLHSISPTIDIAYRNSLSATSQEPAIVSEQRARADYEDTKSGFWHSRVRGAGAPPVKTPFGWLLFYHAMQANEPSKYKLGAMMLDKDDPTKVLARSPIPVLEPETHYETSGIKPGIVYACGTTNHDDKLTLYYGAADNVVCAATTPFMDFVTKLMHHKPAKLSPVALTM